MTDLETTPRIVCGECGYEWPMGMVGPPYFAKPHGEQFAGHGDCPGFFTVVPHYPTPCYCRVYRPRRCPSHAQSTVEGVS